MPLGWRNDEELAERVQAALAAWVARGVAAVADLPPR